MVIYLLFCTNCIPVNLLFYDHFIVNTATYTRPQTPVKDQTPVQDHSSDKAILFYDHLVHYKTIPPLWLLHYHYKEKTR